MKVIEPVHQLTIMSAGEGYKAGRCTCTWNAVASKDQDDIGRQFADHRAEAPTPVIPICDTCQVAAAAVRHGCVDLCGACALDELVRNGELEVVA